MRALLFACIITFTLSSIAVYAAEKTDESSTKSAKEQVIYTCSMHPDVKESKPGKCPICGMELIAVTIKENPQTICPITGKEIDKKFYTDYEGKRVYFCCENCPAEFKKDPAKYVKKLTDEGLTLENTPKPQTMCPVMNEKINKKFFTDYEGKRVYFCCGACPGMFKKNPEKYMKILKEQGVTLEDVAKTQETCPVLEGRPINKKFYVDYEGKRIYFCCPGHDKKFLEDPEKYMKQMKEAGVVLEDAPVKNK
jgi:YHS domain-containing protein